jgi:biotin carboxyl carrier protein
MNSIKQRPFFILFIFQQLILSVFCYSYPSDFVVEEEPRRLVLKQTLRIPVGLKGSVSNSPFFSRFGTPYVDVTEGTPLHEIPARITQRREELGLPSQIPLDQQNEFFQNLTWSRSLSSGAFSIKAPMPGRVRQILVHQNQRVAKGTPICVTEAMKMEMVLRAPYPGVINQIVTQESTLIDTNDALIVLEPSVPFWEVLDPSLIAQHRDFLLPFFPWERALPEENQTAVTPPSGPEGAGENTCILDQRDNIQPLDLASSNASSSHPQPVEGVSSLPIAPQEHPEISEEPIPAPLPPLREELAQPSPTAEKVYEAHQPEQITNSPVLQNTAIISTNSQEKAEENQQLSTTESIDQAHEVAQQPEQAVPVPTPLITMPEVTKLKEIQKPLEVIQLASTRSPVESRSLPPMPVTHPYTLEKVSESHMVNPPSPSPLHEEPKLNKKNVESTHETFTEKVQAVFSEEKHQQPIGISLKNGCIQAKLGESAIGKQQDEDEAIIKGNYPAHISAQYLEDKDGLNLLCQITIKHVTYDTLANDYIVALATRATSTASPWREAGIHGNRKSEDRETINTPVAKRVLAEIGIPVFPAFARTRMTVKGIATHPMSYLFDGELVSLSTYTIWLGCLLVLGNFLLSIKTFGFPHLFTPILSIGLRSFAPFSSIKFLRACHCNRQELLKEIKACNQNCKTLRQKKNRIKRFASLGLHGRSGQYRAA